MNSSRLAIPLSDILLRNVTDDMIFEVCIEMLWSIRTDSYTLEDIYNVFPLSFFRERELAREEYLRAQRSVPSSNVSCPICNESVAGRRFAPHLEKCLNGGKRGGRKHYDALDMYMPTIKEKKVKVIEDPYPNSLIVRIKLKNGAPAANTVRIGASMEEFQQQQSEANNNTKIS